MTVREAGRGAVALLAGVLVVALVAGAGWFGYTSGRLNTVICGGACGPEAVAAPEGLSGSTDPAAARVGSAPSGSFDPDAVAAAVASALDDADLGDRVGFVAIDPADGTVVAERNPDTTFIPASTTKVLTAHAALATLDPQQRFATRVVREGDALTLVGGGDPYLAAERPSRPDPAVRADLETLADRTVASLTEAGLTSVSLAYDASLFEGPAVSEQWESTYVSGQVVTPISALWVDRGVTEGVRTSTPAAGAAERFADLLRERDVDVTGDPSDAVAPAGATQVAAVRSATVGQMVEDLMVRSNNEAAEVILRHVAIAAGEPASFEGGARAAEQALAADGIDVEGLELFDGSGLSRENRVSPTTLAQALSTSFDEPRTAALLAALAVGGFTGTLVDRYDDPADGAGAVRAKTGTLTGVHSLAGVTGDARGVPLVFAVMTDRTEDVNPFVTQAALDDVAAALADCACG